MPLALSATQLAMLCAWQSLSLRLGFSHTAPPTAQSSCTIPHGCTGANGGKTAAGLSEGNTYVDCARSHTGGQAGGGQGKPFSKHDGEGRTGAARACTTMHAAVAMNSARGAMVKGDNAGAGSCPRTGITQQARENALGRERRIQGATWILACVRY